MMTFSGISELKRVTLWEVNKQRRLNPAIRSFNLEIKTKEEMGSDRMKNLEQEQRSESKIYVHKSTKWVFLGL